MKDFLPLFLLLILPLTGFSKDELPLHYIDNSFRGTTTFFILFSDLPPKKAPATMYGAKGKILKKVGDKYEEVGSLKYKPEISLTGKTSPGVMGEMVVERGVELIGELSNREGQKVHTAPVILGAEKVEVPKPLNEWVSKLPPLPKVSECNGIIHNSFSPEPCPKGTKATAWIEGLRCRCVCCEKTK